MTTPVVVLICKRCGQPVTTDNGLCPDCVAELRAEQRGPANASLASILAGLIAKSEDDHRPHMQQLSGGLVVEITLDVALQLRIWRLNQAPSDVEWRTVIAQLPDMYRPAEQDLAYVFWLVGRHHIFSATWPAPARLLL